jgi:dienelactone hydrolase
MRRFLHLVLIFLPIFSSWTVAVPASARKVTSVSRKCIISGTTNTIHKTMPTDANDTIEVPANWNGTLLVYSHGYVDASSPLMNPGPDAPDGATAGKLLAEGYTLSGTSFSKNGWVVQQDMQDQIDLLNYFDKTCGTPKHTIAWGESMGGALTGMLAQSYPHRFSAALPMCGVAGEGKLLIPVMTMNAIGDNVVPVQQARSYSESIKQAGSGAMLRQLFVNHQGHCNFTPGNSLAAIHTLMVYCLNHGRKWGKYDPNKHPDQLNSIANSYGPQYNGEPPAFTSYTPKLSQTPLAGPPGNL